MERENEVSDHGNSTVTRGDRGEKGEQLLFTERNFLAMHRKLNLLEERLNEILSGSETTEGGVNLNRKVEPVYSVVDTPSTNKDLSGLNASGGHPYLRRRVLEQKVENSGLSRVNKNLSVVTTPSNAPLSPDAKRTDRIDKDMIHLNASTTPRRVSFYDYLRLEMTGTMKDDMTHDTDGALGWQEQQLVVSLLSVPFKVESLMTYGLVLATDSFLYVFTYFPLRAIWAIVLLIFRTLSIIIPSSCVKHTLKFSEQFSRVHVYLIIRLFILILAAYAIGFMDMSRAYHYIKMLSFMRLYVIFNLLDIFDKLLTALGQDIFDSLHWATQNRPHDRVWSIFFLIIGGSIYAILHGALTFSRMVSLNVAINTKDNALLTLLISNNFIELKSSVFKRFQPENGKCSLGS